MQQYLGAQRCQQHPSRYLQIFTSAHLRHHPTILQPGKGWLWGVEVLLLEEFMQQKES